MRIGVVVTRASNIAPTWTTAHIIQAACARGHAVRLIEPWDFEVDPRGHLIARAWAFDAPFEDRQRFCDALLRRDARRCYLEVAQLDLLLLRINPMDTAVLTFASLAEGLGVPVLSPPVALLKTSHKGYLATLPAAARPRTLVTRSSATIGAFAEEFRDGVVIKPARASGGRGVRWVRPGHPRQPLGEVREARGLGDGYLVVQEYLPAAADGEKRLVWLDGQILGAYLRRRAPGEFRHNLAQGSLPEPTTPDDRDRELVALVTPHLRRDGVWFAGLDIIGGQLVEVNTLNPGGVHLIDLFSGGDLQGEILRWLEKRVDKPDLTR